MLKKIIIFFSIICFSFSNEISISNIKELYLKSYNYEKMQDYKDAIRVIIPIYNKYPKDYTINLRLGYLFLLNKNYKNSIKHYQKASIILPYSFEPKLGIMKVYLNNGDYNKVILTGLQILKKDFYNYYTNYYLLFSFIQLKKYEKALEITNKMLSIYPTDILFLFNLAKIYYLKKEYYLAKKLFNNILILDPNNIKSKYYIDLINKKIKK